MENTVFIPANMLAALNGSPFLQMSDDELRNFIKPFFYMSDIYKELSFSMRQTFLAERDRRDLLGLILDLQSEIKRFEAAVQALTISIKVDESEA
jgi:hypothetical protein